MQEDFNLSPAQRRLLERLQASGSPIVIVGENRYTLEGDKLHHTVVTALLRRNVLRQQDSTLVLSKVSAETNRASAVPSESRELVAGSKVVQTETASSTPGELATATRQLEALTSAAVGAVRKQDDVANRARQRLREHHDRYSKATGRDDSVFSRLWRKLEDVLTHSVVIVASAAVLAACSPASQQPVVWDYGENQPGGIQVNGPATHEDMLAPQTPLEACQSLGADAFPAGYCEGLQSGSQGQQGTSCESGSAFELFPEGWATPGNPWVSRCR